MNIPEEDGWMLFPNFVGQVPGQRAVQPAGSRVSGAAATGSPHLKKRSTHYPDKQAPPNISRSKGFGKAASAGAAAKTAALLPNALNHFD